MFPSILKTKMETWSSESSEPQTPEFGNPQSSPKKALDERPGLFFSILMERIGTMKWFAVLIIILGFIGFLALNSFESSLPLVQFVKKDSVLTTPVHTMLPPNTKFVAGTGTNGAKFVDIDSDAAKYLDLPHYLWLAKLGTLMVCAFGGIGFAFEVSRDRAKRLYGKPGI